MVPKLINNEKRLTTADYFTYFGSWLTKEGRTVVQVSVYICKSLAAYAGMKHLWHMPDIRWIWKFSILCYSAPSFVVSYQTWSVLPKDVRRLEVFDQRCLRSIVRTGWTDCRSNVKASSQYKLSVCFRVTSHWFRIMSRWTRRREGSFTTWLVGIGIFPIGSQLTLKTCRFRLFQQIHHTSAICASVYNSQSPKHMRTSRVTT